MPKRIIEGTFEQLEELGKSTARQVVQQPKKIAEEAASVVTGKKGEQGVEELGRNPKGFGSQKAKGSGVRPKLTQAQIAQKIEKAAQIRSKLHLQEIEKEINEIQRQRLEQIKRVQEGAFQKTEAVEPQEAQLPSKRKKGLMPVSVKRLKQKVEGWRGAKG